MNVNLFPVTERQRRTLTDYSRIQCVMGLES